jgi:diguanylate cyclase (GGDEF)-like protein/putative nucleotidyltransferase with HDIG domain
VNRHTDKLLSIAPHPAVAEQVLRLAARERASAVDIVRLIQSDPALTARVMWIANSPALRVPRHVASARHASVLLGADLARAIAVSAASAVRENRAEPGSEETWRHAVTTACAAAVVAREFGVSPAAAFSAGMLHDVGATLLQRRDPDAFAVAMASPSMADQVAGEIESFGLTHAEEGAATLDGWGFPAAFVEAVACHQHGVEQPRHALGRIVRIAEAIALEREPMPGYPAARDIDRLLLTSPLRPGSLARIERQIDERLARLVEVHEPSVQPLDAVQVETEQYLTAACIEALGHVDAAQLDPATYLQFAVDLVALLAPTPKAAAIAGIDDRAIDVHSGARIVAGRRYSIAVDGVTIGALIGNDIHDDAERSDQPFAEIAKHVGRHLGVAMRSDQLRRATASDDAAAVASGLSDDTLLDGLGELAMSLASFPAVRAAEVVVDDVTVGPPFSARAGFWGDDGNADAVERFAVDWPGPSRSTLRLRVAEGETTDEAAVEAVLQRLKVSVERIAHARAFRLEAEVELLTGLGNRRRLQRVLESTLDRAARACEQVALLLLDIEGFKRVCDELGDEAGDAVLVGCAAALRDRISAYDEGIRLDGSEFVVVAPVPDILDAFRLAEDLRTEIGRRGDALLPGDWGLTATIGIALYPDAAGDPENLLRAADIALYQAKAAGRDGVRVAEPAEPQPPNPAPTDVDGVTNPAE